jgi:type II secretory pathway component PulF
VPDYWYRALKTSGAVEEGWTSAENENHLEEQIREKGAYLVASEEKERPSTGTDAVIPRKELLAFLEYLAGSFTAGLPILTILDDVQPRLRSRKLKAILKQVREAVATEGVSLSAAMARHPKAFPQLYVATIRAGEASGQLAFSLEQLVDYLDWQENITTSVRQATMYPIIVLVAVGLLVTGLIGFVFPRILPILRMRQTALPLPTKIMMATSAFLQQYWLALLVAVALAVVAFVLVRRTENGRFRIDSLLLKIPVVGKFVLEVNIARVVTYLSLFYKAGVDLLQSLTLVEQMVTNVVVARLVHDTRNRIAGGESLAAAFGRSPLVPMVVMRSLALGESTGKLDDALDRAKVYYGREIPARVRQVITLIQPMLIVVLGGVILLVALAIMMPILNIYSSIGIRR